MEIQREGGTRPERRASYGQRWVQDAGLEPKDRIMYKSMWFWNFNSCLVLVC